jgi:hypothetical protein
VQKGASGCQLFRGLLALCNPEIAMADLTVQRLHYARAPSKTVLVVKARRLVQWCERDVPAPHLGASEKIKGSI